MKQKVKRGKVVSFNKWGYIFLIPFVVVYVTFQLIPLFRTIYNSLFENYMANGGLVQVGPNWVGLQNYSSMFKNPDLWKFLNHPLVPPQSKKDTLAKIFKDSLSPIVLQFMYVMIDRRREAALLLAIDGFIDLARKAQHIEVAKIRVVKPLSKKEETKLVASLEAMTGQHIEPLYYVDPSLIGGMVIQIGDKLIDGSLRRQLRDMQHKLLQADVTNGVTDE